MYDSKNLVEFNLQTNIYAHISEKTTVQKLELFVQLLATLL